MQACMYTSTTDLYTGVYRALYERDSRLSVCRSCTFILFTDIAGKVLVKRVYSTHEETVIHFPQETAAQSHHEHMTL